MLDSWKENQEKNKWGNRNGKMVQEVKQQRRENSKCTRPHTRTCRSSAYVKEGYTRWQKENKKSHGWWNDEN